MTTQDILGLTVVILAIFFCFDSVFEYVKEKLK
ncbi:hypothetical protein F889_02924 [Acinetobacter colistiniresistens]|uniref:Uncharacterized protein n=1 Tax=Acinetobacter colistiniresistens TaxID=280145 RepID=N9R6K7_9GAMM|nr:hypothetical protein F889_02931 [Acinetobacter colistiniresistens]ENX34260.1 hypothetical protein F889_02924 [Acinetobacter colistiniresistens]